jgi:hypothetical protein
MLISKGRTGIEIADNHLSAVGVAGSIIKRLLPEGALSVGPDRNLGRHVASQQRDRRRLQL